MCAKVSSTVAFVLQPTIWACIHSFRLCQCIWTGGLTFISLFLSWCAFKMGTIQFRKQSLFTARKLSFCSFPVVLNVCVCVFVVKVLFFLPDSIEPLNRGDNLHNAIANKKCHLMSATNGLPFYFLHFSLALWLGWSGYFFCVLPFATFGKCEMQKEQEIRIVSK